MKSCLQRPQLWNVTKTTPIRSGRVSLPYAIPRCSRGFWRDPVPPFLLSVDNRATTAEINNKIQRSSAVGHIPSVIVRRRHSKEHISGAPPLHILRLRSPHSSRPRKPHPWWPRPSPGTSSNPWWPWTFLSRLATAAARERRTPGLGGRKKGRGAKGTGYWASLWLHERRIVLVAALTRQATLRLLESFWGLVCRVDCQRATGYLPISLRTGSGLEVGTVSRDGRFGH
ncbi:hypothetical protein BKA56DRAFT_347346 [Ilyonectria sp. MPI-CAGE-AT-0026]|nr:hypothetical protein BKA56DRAFT_347346 [Ilyonectria sp. MPI-CAGE-AT-0026]